MMATRVGINSGSTTETGYAPTPGGHVFYVLEKPDEIRADAVLICSPLYSEHLRNNRREVLLSRGLTAHGIPSLRFHYRGFGNSDGDSADATAQSMVEDIANMNAFLAERLDVAVSTVAATRMGTTLASHADLSADTYALWDPIHNGASFVRDALRARMIMETKSGVTMSSADLTEMMERDGYIGIAGFPVTKSLRDSTKDFKLPTGASHIKHMHVTIFRTGEMGGAERRALEVWAPDLAEPMTVVSSDFEEGWWFHQNTNLLTPEESEKTYRVTVDRTLDWIVNR